MEFPLQTAAVIPAPHPEISTHKSATGAKKLSGQEVSFRIKENRAAEHKSNTVPITADRAIAVSGFFVLVLRVVGVCFFAEVLVFGIKNPDI